MSATKSSVVEYEVLHRFRDGMGALMPGDRVSEERAASWPLANKEAMIRLGVVKPHLIDSRPPKKAKE